MDPAVKIEPPLDPLEILIAAIAAILLVIVFIEVLLGPTPVLQ